MKYPGNIKPLHGGIQAAPFVGVLFLMVPMLLFHTSLVFKPGVTVDLSLPVSAQKTGVTDPSLSIAVDAEGMLHFHNKQVVPQVFSETVKVSVEVKVGAMTSGFPGPSGGMAALESQNLELPL